MLGPRLATVVYVRERRFRRWVTPGWLEGVAPFALDGEYASVLFSMPKRQPYARIAITLPEADLAAADRLAAEQDRSRSWIVAEAIRRYAASEALVAPAADIGSSRREQLRRDLALAPEERVREAEETQRLVADSTAPLSFASYDAFSAWRQAAGSSK